MGTTTADSSVVWILGAGFSQPLGGPLLTDLFSKRSKMDLRALYPDVFSSALTDGIPDLYEKGLGNGGYERRWGDGEAFLDALDGAARKPEGPLATRLLGLATLSGVRGVSIRDLSVAARRTIAAECCAFLEGVETSSERWQPFTDWAKELDDRDTLLTFNYDRVIETACSAANTRLHIAKGVNNANAKTGDGGLMVPTLVKLHGSVDWKRVADGAEVRAEVQQDPRFALRCAPDDMLVATPGPTKKETAGELANLWSYAENRLLKASVVVLIGFRFPPSDAAIRRQIVDALAANDLEERPHLSVHVVLGPDTCAPDTKRTVRMLEFACRRRGRNQVAPGAVSPRPSFSVDVHPLWGQDFLSLWKRELL